jgi:DNA-binding transcriptional regulator LsrR (DeoR family)
MARRSARHGTSYGGKQLPFNLLTRSAIPLRVLAAGGMAKVAIISAAIKAGLCHVLITDETAAMALVRS